MKTRNYPALAILLLCGACTTTNPNAVTGKRPSWMENPHLKYPEMYFISAVGEGDTIDDARNVAAANLAKIFRSDIRVEERVEERYFELIGEKNSYQEKTKFERDVNIGSGISLVNVNYGEIYRDKTGRYYTPAYINRKKTAAIYLTRLKENDQRIREFIQQSQSGDAPLAYAALSAALAISSAGNLLLEQLDIISPAAKKSIQMTYSHDEIARRCAAAAKALSFSVQIDGDSDGKVTAAVNELITGMGFVIKRDGVMKIDGSVAFEETDIGRDSLEFVRYNLTLNVKTGGVSVAGITARGREGHVSLKEAQARCLRSIVDLINKRLAKQLQDYFDSLIRK
jgi:hypothetical protein